DVGPAHVRLVRDVGHLRLAACQYPDALEEGDQAGDASQQQGRRVIEVDVTGRRKGAAPHVNEQSALPLFAGGDLDPLVNRLWPRSTASHLICEARGVA